MSGAGHADFGANINAALAEADRAFAQTGDVMLAIGFVALAAKAGIPIPPHIGRWLHGAINDYRAGSAPSLDAALGLNSSGRANPRRRKIEESALQGALARMLVLHTLGATIPQAAALVASLSPDFKPATLTDRYRRRGRGKLALAQRDAVLALWHRTEVEQVLAEYPDRRGEAAEGKAAVRSMYAKHRT